MTPETDPPPPSVAIATPDVKLRARLASLLGRTDVDVVTVDPHLEEWWRKAAESNATVILIQSGQVESARSRRAVARLAASDDAPEVVVIGEDVDPVTHAEIVAAGAASVLEQGPGLADALESVAEVLEQRGPARPDTGRSMTEPRLADFRSRSLRMSTFLEMVEQVKGTDSSLLITGETGVGKEHLARAVHAESPRAGGPFVSVNCGAIPEHLLESELFGHEKGAFTGAAEKREGRFREADGGTIFLDEIGDLPKPLQVTLLTVLQRHEVRPLGSKKPIRVDVRVMAATNRDLAAEVEAGRFREDLYYRLNVIPLEIPPLRERVEDIPELVGVFMRHFREATDREDVTGISHEAMEAILRHDWPGNIRELINVIERAVLLCKSNAIARSDLALAPIGTAPGGESAAVPDDWMDLPFAEAKKRVLEDFEREYIVRLLERTGGRVGESAEIAGIAARTLYEKMKRLGLKKEQFRR